MVPRPRSPLAALRNLHPGWRWLLVAITLVLVGIGTIILGSRATSQWGLSVAIIGGIVLLTGCLYAFPRAVAGAEGTQLIGARRLTLENEIRGTLVQMLLGAVILVGAASTWQQLLISRDTQVTEQFTGAVGQLGEKPVEVRLGAIYTLERVATTAEPGDRMTVYRLLAGYVKARSQWRPPPKEVESEKHSTSRHRPLEFGSLRKRAPDIQAAVDVLSAPGKKLPHGEEYRAFLTDVDLRGVDLQPGAQLHDADLRGAKLDYLDGRVEPGRPHPDLRDADLRSASLRCAQLQGVDLRGADLRGADLRDANLRAAGQNQADAKLDDKPQVTGALWNERTRWPSSFQRQLDPRQLNWQSDAADEPPGVACNAAEGQQRPGQLHCHDDRFCTKEQPGDIATLTGQQPRPQDGPL
jgi:Pentapeptide repeats (8 copies)